MAASEQAATRKDTKIPIASLNPFRKVDRPASIEAIITLIWPFTSANGKAAFLCAEPDFRLRRDKGQVRVQFSKDAAKAVATSGVGIGDTIRLSLAGARWTQHDHATKTPGRSVEGEMLFNRQLRLRAWRGGQELANIDIDAPASPTLQQTPRQMTRSPQSPRRPKPPTPLEAGTWSSPTFLCGAKTFNTEIFSSGFDPFAEEENVGLGGPRKRAKFGRSSGEWRYVSGGPLSRDMSVPGEQGQSPGREMNIEDGAADVRKDDPSKPIPTTPTVESRMASPALPPVRTDAITLPVPAGAQQDSAQLVAPRSPKLTPVKSPGLPLVSPFQGQIGSGPGIGFLDDESLRRRLGPSVTLENQLNSPTGLWVAAKDEGIPDFGLDGSALSRDRSQEHGMDSQDLVREFPPSNEDMIQDGQEGQVQGSSQTSSHSRFTDTGNTKGAKEGGQEIPTTHEQGEGTQEKSQQVKERNETTKATKSSQRATAKGGSPVQIPTPARHMSEQRTPARTARDLHKQNLTSTPGFSSQDQRRLIQSQVEKSLFGFSSPSPSMQIFDKTQENHLAESTANREKPQIMSEPLSQSNTGPMVQAEMTPQPSQEPPARRDLSKAFHRVDQLLNQELPLTPATSQPQLEEPTTSLSPKRPISITPDVAKSAKDKSSARQLKPTYIEVPEVLSPWFRSRHAGRSRPRHPNPNGAQDEPHVTQEDAHNQHRNGLINDGAQNGAPSQEYTELNDYIPRGRADRNHQFEQREAAAVANHHMLTADGFRTPLSYYAPLSSLDTYLTASSTDGHMTIDVFAIVTSPSSEPAKSKSGPKDFHTVMHITDFSAFPEKIQVQCFCPWPKALPSVEVGDVVILRNFVVKSRKRQCFLLSAGASAWFTWRFSKRNKPGEVNGHAQRPIWAQRASDSEKMGLDALEECLGPPVEVGAEERKHAAALQSWWESKSQKQSA